MIWSSGDFYKEVTKLPLGWRCCRLRTRWHDKAKLSHLRRDDWRDNFFLLTGENLFRKWFFNLTRWLSVTWDQKNKNWNLKGHLFIRQQFLKSAIHWESKAFFILPHVYNINVFKQFLSKKRNEPYWYAKIQTNVFNPISFIERPCNRSHPFRHL